MTIDEPRTTHGTGPAAVAARIIEWWQARG